MAIEQLHCHQFRNLLSAQIPFGSGLNVIYGPNGSGKTSILEAVHFLGMGRSFRTHLANRTIHSEHDSSTIYAQLNDSKHIHKLGMQRDRNGSTTLRLNQQTIKSAAQLAHLLPIQVITPESFSILFEGPKARRQYIDWGVFHNDASFHKNWVSTKRLIRHRNALLKAGKSLQELAPWDSQLIEYANAVNGARKAYIDSLNVAIQGIIELFLPDKNIQIGYYQGWDKASSYQDCLIKQYQRDISLGYTSLGPHKADLKLKIGTASVQDVLSRGQLKLLVCALKLAQGNLLTQMTQKKGIYLVDDLPSELDSTHRAVLLNQLLDTQAQLLVTAIEPQAILAALPNANANLIQVSHGTVMQHELPKEI